METTHVCALLACIDWSYRMFSLIATPFQWQECEFDNLWVKSEQPRYWAWEWSCVKCHYWASLWQRPTCHPAQVRVILLQRLQLLDGLYYSHCLSSVRHRCTVRSKEVKCFLILIMQPNLTKEKALSSPVLFHFLECRIASFVLRTLLRLEYQ